jgi:hypothetical protein
MNIQRLSKFVQDIKDSKMPQFTSEWILLTLVSFIRRGLIAQLRSNLKFMVILRTIIRLLLGVEFKSIKAANRKHCIVILRYKYNIRSPSPYFFTNVRKAESFIKSLLLNFDQHFISRVDNESDDYKVTDLFIYPVDYHSSDKLYSIYFEHPSGDLYRYRSFLTKDESITVRRELSTVLHGRIKTSYQREHKMCVDIYIVLKSEDGAD